MTTKRTQQKLEADKSASRRSWFIIGGAVFALTAGLMAVTWVCIDNLQENARRIDSFQVKQSPAIKSRTVELTVADQFLSKDAYAVPTNQPGHTESNRLFLAARSLARSGDYNAAISMYVRSHHILSNEMSKGVLATEDPASIAARFAELGYCYYKLGNFVAAEKELTWAVGARPDYAPYYRQRAAVYSALRKQNLASADAAKADYLVAHPFSSPKGQAFEQMLGTGSPEDAGH